jgi:hypothetical protein
LRSLLDVYCMRTGVCGCICMLYVILVNTCRVDQLIFIVHCVLSKLQINLVKKFHFSVKNSKNRLVSRLTDGLEQFLAGFSPVNRFEFKLIWIGQIGRFLPVSTGKSLPVGSGFCRLNGFVNRECSGRLPPRLHLLMRQGGRVLLLLLLLLLASALLLLVQAMMQSL